MKEVQNNASKSFNSQSQLNQKGTNENTREAGNSDNLNSTLYFSAKTVSLLGTNIYNFAMSLYILLMTGSGISFAINILIGYIPRILLGPVAGVIADRINRKRAAFILDLSSGGVMFAMLAAAAAGGLPVGLIYITGLILSIINVFYDTCLGSSIPALVTDKNLVKINTMTQASVSLSGIFSPIIGGLVYGFAPIQLFLAINGISFFISAALVFLLKYRTCTVPQNKKPDGPRTKSFTGDLKEVFGFLKGQRVVTTLFKYALILNFVLMASVSVVIPFVINKSLAMGSSRYGILQAFLSVGILVTSVVMGKRKETGGKFTGIAMGTGGMGLFIILAGLPTLGNSSAWGILLMPYMAASVCGIGIAMVMANTPVMVMLQRLTPDRLMGRVMGMLGTLTGGIAPLGIVIAGLLIDKVHPFTILLVSGIFVIISAIMLRFNKNFTDGALEEASMGKDSPAAEDGTAA